MAVTITGAATGSLSRMLAGDTDAVAARVDEAIDRVFLATGVDRRDLSGRTAAPAERAAGAPRSEVTLPLPEGETYSRLNAEITRAVQGAGGDVFEVLERGRDPESPDGLEIRLGTREEVTHLVKVRSPARGSRPFERVDVAPPPRIAVVFDDLGYSTEGLARELLELPVTLTFAVLPGLRRSEAFAEAARAHGHEIILHLPLEPLDTVRHDPGRNALFVDLEPAENLRRLRGLLDGLSAYSGVSNHMGSRFSADTGSVELVLGELKRRDRSLFFLDSRTTPYSVIGERAHRLGVPCLTNNIFLDSPDPANSFPVVQTQRLLGIARRQGRAIGIGHVRRETVDAVKSALPRWREEGIRLVGLSDLMQS